ncbi:MAG: sigma-70 family RNA polymerase sigma factor [Pseudomonadota bacterium]
MSDDPISDLIHRIAQADRGALRSFYAAAGGKLFAVCLRMLQDRTEAEDALQEVVTRVWLNARRYDPAKARGMTWAIAIARNHCIDRLRARPPGTEDESALATLGDPAPGPEAQAVAGSEARRLADCLATLEAARAEAIRGAYLSGLSYEELARRHAVPLNTMRSWLRRGLLKLRECLEP